MNNSNPHEEQKQRFQSLRNDIEKIDALDETSDEKQILHIQDRLYRMIEYAIKRHDWYEEQKQKLLQIGIAILGTSAALMAIIAKLSTNFSILTEIFAWLFALSLFLTGLSLVFLFNHYIGRNHPYRKVVDIRSWYFKYNFPSGLKDHLSRNFNKAKSQVREIVDSFEIYRDRVVENICVRKISIKEDIEQVFILQLLQRYRFKHLNNMTKVLLWGLISSCVFLFATIGTYRFTNQKNEPDTTSTKTITVTDSTSTTIITVSDSLDLKIPLKAKYEFKRVE